METTPPDVFSRLESAVSAWSDELQAAHSDLEQRLADAATRLAQEVEGGLLDTRPIVDALRGSQEHLDSVHTSLQDLVERSRDLERRQEALQAAVQSDTALRATVAGIAERLDQLEAASGSGEAVESLRAEVTELRNARENTSSDNSEIEALRADVAALKEQIQSAPPVDDALVREFANVGMEVSQLRSALKELGIADDSGHGRDTSQADSSALFNGLNDDPGDIDSEGAVAFRDPADEPVSGEHLTDDALRRLAFDESGHRRRMGDILKAAKAISEGDLDEALSRQSRLPTKRLGSILVELGAATELTIARVLSAQLQLPYVELNPENISDNAVELVHARLARKHKCLPMAATADTIRLAMANPLDLIAIEDVELATGRRVEPVVATQSHVDAAIEDCYGPEVVVVPNDESDEEYDAEI
jgi:hypothetical protein